MPNVLIACEESQAVTIEMRKIGIDAYSCDILPCSGGYPEWHLQKDVKEVLKEKWDLIIAFPPCTFLTAAGQRWFNIKRYHSKARQRYIDRQDSFDFFMKIANADCDKIAIENPVGYINTHWRKPDQIIQPWQFGDAFEKKTCLWLKNLQKLKYTKIVTPPKRQYYASGKSDSLWRMECLHLPAKERAKMRSKTFPGIAKAMAHQWGKLL